MAWNPKETNRLLVFAAAELARKRKARRLKLNHPETMALLTDEIFEEARACRSHAEVVEHARNVLSHEDVMEGVSDMLAVVQVDALFPDGARWPSATPAKPLNPPCSTTPPAPPCELARKPMGYSWTRPASRSLRPTSCHWRSDIFWRKKSFSPAFSHDEV